MWAEPSFWYSPSPGPWPRLLAPLGALYAAAVAIRRAITRPAAAPVPVICIGNPGHGGGGKTPAAIAIARRLAALGEAPHFLTRGYGGRLAGPVTVVPDRHAAADVGDEPLLLARHAPTHVARDRRAGAAHAAQAGARVIVMDDGFHNPTLRKDLSLLVVDGQAGCGNGRMFPAGPLREPLGAQLARAGAVIVVGDGEAGRRFAGRAGEAGVPVLRATLKPAPDAPDLAAREVVAFCAIARPEKFEASLAGAGARIVRVLTFPDHHPFSQGDIAQILQAGDAHQGAVLVTTEKDRVRLGDANDPDRILRSRAETFPVEMAFADKDRLDDLLKRALGR